MNKYSKKFLLVPLVALFLVTGCGNDTCVKWKTVTTGGKDCSKIDAAKKPNEYQYCKMTQEKQTTTQECIEWK